MNKILIFLIISTAIVAFSVITLSSAPLINKTIGGIGWATENCQFYADNEELTDNLDNKYSLHRQKTLCERRKAMYGLEYASFIFDVISGFLCLLLSFLRYLKIGKGTEKNTGLVGLITGIIGFVLTFIYFVYSAYIFTNDTPGIEKLFPNGASKKQLYNIGPITAYEGDKGDDAQFIKYNELGQKQYNYDSDYHRIYNYPGNKCLEASTNNNCEYYYAEPKEDNENKYIYDKWTNTLVFSFLISICNIGLIVFGILLFIGGEESK